MTSTVERWEPIGPRSLTTDSVGATVDRVRNRAAERVLVRRASVAGVLAGLIPFVLVLWNVDLDPLRTPRVERFASNFYDVQARALFRGHLALPDRILGIESFVVDGRTYMYFPPFPAVLRMPVLAVTDRFDGSLTAPSMLLAWTVFAVAVVSLVWTVRRVVCGTRPVSRFDAIASAVLIAAITGGTVLLYIAALPWVYHEVYLWAAALSATALAGFAALADPLRKPSWRYLAVIAVGVVGLILTRTTVGWPMAIATVASGVHFAVRRSRRQVRAGLVLVAIGIVALAISSTINWMKFRHPYMIPLQYQEWTAINARRRLALMVNGGSLATPEFLPTTIINYFRPDGIRLVPWFPFVTLPAEPGRGYAGAFVDQAYRTGSVPAFMPLLFTLAVWGYVVAFRRHAGQAIAALRLPMLGSLFGTAMVMSYGYIGFRYTSDFVAPLTIAAAVGLADICGRLTARQRRTRAAVMAVGATLAAFGIFANASVGLATAAVTGRGEPLVQMVSMQERLGAVAGTPPIALTTDVGALPSHAPADTLYIAGDCDALYMATGDLYEPWVTVEMRPLRVVVEAAATGYRPALLPLFDLRGERPRRVMLESDADNRVRLHFVEGIYFLPTRWQVLRPGDTIEVTMIPETSRDQLQVTFGQVSESIRLAEWNRSWELGVVQPTLATAPLREQLRAGISLSPIPAEPPAVCNRLLDVLAS